MEITERAIHLLAEVERSVQACYIDFADLAHGFEHVQRVYHLAYKSIHIRENLDRKCHELSLNSGVRLSSSTQNSAF